MQLPPEPHDDLTWDFEALKRDDQKSCKGNKWILDKMWALISHRIMLRRTEWLSITTGCGMQWQIYATLKPDWEAQTAVVGASIERKLAGGDVQEACCHLKGWYWATTSTTAHPCHHTMVRQAAECAALCARSEPPGDPLPINIAPVDIGNGSPTDAKTRDAAQISLMDGLVECRGCTWRTLSGGCVR
jgi:hypothetical protein